MRFFGHIRPAQPPPILTPQLEPDLQATGQFAHLMENAGGLVFLFDANGRLRIGNKAFREAMFINESEQPTREEFMRRNFHAKRGAKIVSPILRNGVLRSNRVAARTHIAFLRSTIVTVAGFL